MPRPPIMPIPTAAGSAGRPARRANDQVSAGDIVLGTHKVENLE